MEHSSPGEANSHQISQEIPHLLHTQKVHYCIYNKLPLVPILSQMHPVRNFQPYLPKIHYNIISPSMSKSSEWSLPFRFYN
jgi:hypothetical protein